MPSATMRDAVVFLSLFSLVNGQNAISTDFQVPPLQWLHLNPSGFSPPPLMDSSIGYDNINRLLVLFGGETSQGLAYSGTHILDTRTLQWRPPKTPPANLAATPPARSLALAGPDSAANYRRDFALYGGRNQQGQALSDLWFFSYDQEFWYQAQIPSPPPARYAAVGGTDPIQSPNAELLTIFRVAGGTDGTTSFPLSDVWTLSIKDTLAANVQTVSGTWRQNSTRHFDSKVRSTSTVMANNRLVVFGGCNFSQDGTYNSSCATRDAYLADFGTAAETSWNAMGNCPSGRYRAVMAPNLNVFSPAFATQVFLLLGITDSNLWSDDDASAEVVDILDVAQGTWARVRPSCDPGPSGGTPVCPSAREGASVVVFPGPIVGETKLTWDILVFGGRDASGRYLNDLWLLRGFGGVINGSSSGNWGGYGNGHLETGIEASGMGVTVNFLSKCATALVPSASPTQKPSGPNSGHDEAGQLFEYDVSSLHKLFSPLSVALFLPALILYRLSSPPTTQSAQPRRMMLVYLATLIALIGYVLGVIGFALSLTTTVRNRATSNLKREIDQDAFMRSAHGQAGIIFFVMLYVAIPILMVVVRRHRKKEATSVDLGEKPRKDSQESGAAMRPALGPVSPRFSRATSDGGDTDVDDSSPAPTFFGKGSFLPGSWGKKRIPSNDSSKDPPATSGFEVVNRGRGAQADSARSRRNVPPRNFSELSWLDRRRDLSNAGDMDFAMSQMSSQGPPQVTPKWLGPAPDAAADAQSGHQFMFHSPELPPTPATPPPTLLDASLHLLFQALLLAINIYSLVALWQRAQIIAFVVFTAWTALFYVLFFLLAWQGRPRRSLLALLLRRLRGDAITPIATTRSTNPTPEPTLTNMGPYTHQPPYRRVPHDDSPTRLSQQQSNSGEDDDEDDAERQWRIEQEMERRDVSIITVPKRRLVIVNNAQ